MSDATPPHLPPLEPGRTRGQVWWAAFGAWAATVVVIFALAQLGPVVPLLSENAAVIAALLFLWLPHFVLRRQGANPEALGIRGEEWKRGAVVTLLVCAVVFPLFAAGYHVFATEYRDQQAALDDHAFHRWPERVEGTPVDFPPQKPVAVWANREHVTVMWAPPEGTKTVDVRVELDAPIGQLERVVAKDGKVWHRRWSVRRGETFTRDDEANALVLRARAAGGLRLVSEEARGLRVAVEFDGEPVDGGDWALGRWGMSADEGGLDTRRGPWWVLWLVLVNLLVVAVPEEVFYRGFLGSRMDQLFVPTWNFLGARIGVGLVITSALFALGHYLVEFQPGRLTVFFPSLLFGWLRSRTGGVGAASVVHALSNVLLAFLNGAYV